MCILFYIQKVRLFLGHTVYIPQIRKNFISESFSWVFSSEPVLSVFNLSIKKIELLFFSQNLIFLLYFSLNVLPFFLFLYNLCILLKYFELKSYIFYIMNLKIMGWLKNLMKEVISNLSSKLSWEWLAIFLLPFSHWQFSCHSILTWPFIFITIHIDSINPWS